MLPRAKLIAGIIDIQPSIFNNNAPIVFTETTSNPIAIELIVVTDCNPSIKRGEIANMITLPPLDRSTLPSLLGLHPVRV